MLNVAGASGARYSLLPLENATGNYVKVVQRIPVKVVFEKGQDPEHVLRPGYVGRTGCQGAPTVHSPAAGTWAPLFWRLNDAYAANTRFPQEERPTPVAAGTNRGQPSVDLVGRRSERFGRDGVSGTR